MTDWTPAEKQLLKLVKDEDLQTGLRLIRAAGEAIWSPELRIVQDFTDHGPAHSARLAQRATELLRANTGPKLTTEEAYLLLAGIYVHDIGMQCDVVRHPEVKAQAEKLGAEFGIEFTAERAAAPPWKEACRERRAALARSRFAPSGRASILRVGRLACPAFRTIAAGAGRCPSG